MKNDWKDKFDKEFKERHFCCASDYCEGDCDSYTRKKLKTFIESLLEEQKKELINLLLSKGEDNSKIFPIKVCSPT